MKKALIFLHGDLADISQLPPAALDADLIIAADGGAEYAIQAGLTPHILIGDMDSISPSTMKQLNNKSIIKVYPREKDHTDAELAVQYALTQQVTGIYMAGFLGRRIDHMMANLAYLSTLPVPVTLFEGTQQLTLIRNRSTISCKKGYEVSLLPLQEDCIGISTYGLRYPLDNETLPYGSTRGVSNVLIKESATVTIQSGTLLCILSATD